MSSAQNVHGFPQFLLKTMRETSVVTICDSTRLLKKDLALFKMGLPGGTLGICTQTPGRI